MKKYFVLFILMAFAVSLNAQKVRNNHRLNINTKKLERLMDLKKGEGLLATFETNLGDFVIELFPEQAPKTVKNFVGLAESEFYNGVTFHRVIDNFMIQGGDPTGTGSGGESIYGSTFEDEFVPELVFNKTGILAMANRGPNTNSSQFFITLAETPWLNHKHTIFGKVIDGMGIVKTIGKVQTTKPFDKPVQDVVIKSIAIKKFVD